MRDDYPQTDQSIAAAKEATRRDRLRVFLDSHGELWIDADGRIHLDVIQPSQERRASA